MKALPLLRRAALACALAVCCFTVESAFAQAPVATAPGVAVGKYAGGFNNPRGLTFTPAGSGPRRLIVAEGGLGGTNSTAGLCDQIEPPIGPYTGSPTGARVSIVIGAPYFDTPTRRTIIDRLPSSQTSPDSGSLVSGVADVAFIGDQLYMLISGASCTHGVVPRENAIIKLGGDGKPVLVANLARWLRANPGGELGPDVEPDGTWYSMTAYNGKLYVIEPNQGLFVRVDPATGGISRILDVSRAAGAHVVPTSLNRYKGFFYIANLGTFPIMDDTQHVWRYRTDPPRLQSVARATAILGIAFDPRDDAMYILQMTSGAPGPTPGMGSILRLRPGGSPVKIVDGLTLPTAIAMGPDGALYVSHIGFGPPVPGIGEILRVTLPD